MWRLATLSVVLFPGCSLPRYVEYSPETTFVQYFEDQRVCLVVGTKRFAEQDTSWISDGCLQRAPSILDAHMVYLDINDSTSVLDALDSLGVRPFLTTCEILNDTVYTIHRYAPQRCCTCNYAITPWLGRMTACVLDAVMIVTRGGRIVSVVGELFYV